MSVTYKCILGPAELQAKAKEELSEDPKTRHLEIKTFRERLKRNHSIVCPTDDAFLLRFLRARKFDQERAYELLMRNYQLKFEHADLFATMTPSSIEHILHAGVTGFLEHSDKDGAAVWIYSPGKWDAEKYSIWDVFKSTYLGLSQIVKEDFVQICGVRMIANVENLNWSHAKNYSPSFVKHATSLYQDTFPVRLKGIHIINEPAMFSYFYEIFKTYFKDKIRRRLYFHGTRYEELREFIDEEYLPQDLGGKLPPFNNAKYVENLLQCEEEFKKETKYGLIDMKMHKRHKSKAVEDAMDAPSGAFRKLNVD